MRYALALLAALAATTATAQPPEKDAAVCKVLRQQLKQIEAAQRQNSTDQLREAKRKTEEKMHELSCSYMDQ